MKNGPKLREQVAQVWRCKTQEVFDDFIWFDEHEHRMIEVVTNDYRGMQYQPFQGFLHINKVLTLYSESYSEFRISDKVTAAA